MVERREFPRRALSEDVHCYIDGVRFDARTLDLSAGGTFIRTTRWRQVSLGALVGLVFPRNRLSPHTTFLFGRVARIQEGVVEGLALAWEKAVTVAPAEDLARFLKATFGIEGAEIQREAPGPRGESRNVFLFASVSQARLRAKEGAEEPARPVPPAAPASARPVDAAPGGTPADSDGVVVELEDPFDAASLGADALQVSAEDLDALDLKVIALDRDGTRLRDAAREAPATPLPAPPPARDPLPTPPPESEPPPLPFIVPPPGVEAAPAPTSEGAPRRGQISVMVARDAQLGVALTAVLEVGDDRLHLEVVRLGLEGAFVRTAFAPLRGDAEPVLRFEIPARRGPVAVACLCAPPVPDAGPNGQGGGLRLRFVAVDEGPSPGILERYLKYLQFQDLARS